MARSQEEVNYVQDGEREISEDRTAEDGSDESKVTTSSASRKKK